MQEAVFFFKSIIKCPLHAPWRINSGKEYEVFLKIFKNVCACLKKCGIIEDNNDKVGELCAEKYDRIWQE